MEILGNNIIKEIKMESGLPTISVAMIVKNESEKLGALLEILNGAVEEVIIVDTGSTDNTKEIAIKGGAKVYDFPWNDSFSDARNESLKYCTKDYILFLDADDLIEKQKLLVLKQHFSKFPNTGVFIRLIDVREDNVFETIQLRAFPRVFPNQEKPKFIYHVHEQVSFSLEENGVLFSSCTDFPLVHKGYDISMEEIQKKLERNLRLTKLDLEERPDDFVVLMTAARTTLNMGKMTQTSLYLDKALELVKSNKFEIAKEHVLMAYILKATLFGYQNDDKGGIKLLESVRYMFPENPVIKYTLGEMYYKIKNYEKAYKELLFIREGGMPITSYPMDREVLYSKYNKLLLASSLVVNDWKTASICLGRFIDDESFTFTVNKKKK